MKNTLHTHMKNEKKRCRIRHMHDIILLVLKSEDEYQRVVLIRE